MKGKFVVIEGLDGVGKSTLIRNLNNVMTKVVTFSPSSLCKTELWKDKLDWLTGMNGLPNGIPLYKIDYDAIHDIIKVINSILDMLHEEIKINGHKCKHNDSYKYNSLMSAYIELGVLLTPLINYLKDQGYVVIADRWMASSIAYNGLIENTYVSKAMQLSTKLSRGYLCYNPNIEIENDDIELYQHLTKFLHTSVQDVIVPDAFIYLQENISGIIENINKRGEASIFESERKLTRTSEVYGTLIRTQQLGDNAVLNLGESISVFSNVLTLGEKLVTEKVLERLKLLLDTQYFL